MTDSAAMTSELDSAIAQLEDNLALGGQATRSVAHQLRTVIAAAKRPLLTEATRERLVAIQTRAERDWINGRITEFETTSRQAIADAILAEFRPVVSTRERLAEGIEAPFMALRSFGSKRDYMRAVADIVLASRAVEDRAEVEARALESVANNDGMGAHFLTAEQSHILRARAASIREDR